MYSNKVCGVVFLLVLNSHYSVSLGHWISDLRSAMQINFKNDDNEIKNTTNLSEELLEGNLTNSFENEILLAMPVTNNTAETDSEIQMDALIEPENENATFQVLEDSAESETNATHTVSTNSTELTNNKPEQTTENIWPSEVFDLIMDEKIELQRNNCHLEIAVQESHDLKIAIKFGKLESNTFGKCYITLNSNKRSMLGIMISNIHLYQNGSYGEVLKVITADYGMDFVLKKYYPWTKYQPLLLTETHKVYIVLFYNVANVSLNEETSHFNLEVFNYHKYENYIHDEDNYWNFPYEQGAQNVPTNEPIFVPYFH